MNEPVRVVAEVGSAVVPHREESSRPGGPARSADE